MPYADIKIYIYIHSPNQGRKASSEQIREKAYRKETRVKANCEQPSPKSGRNEC